MKDRSTRSFIANVVAMPAWFLAAFGIAFVLAFAADAAAQPAEAPEPAGSAMPEHGFAPPSDEQPPVGGDPENPTDPKAQHDDNTGVGTGPTVHENEHGHAGTHAEGGQGHGHGDPTKNFNWFDFGYSGKDQRGGKFGDGIEDGQPVTEEEGMPAPYIAAFINFLLLIGILLWKGRPVAQSMAAERHDQIKNALEEAATLRQAAADKLAEYEANLKKSDEEIKAIVDGIRASAEADKARILESAERAAAQMKKDAESRIAAEIELARHSLTREVTNAAAAATETLLREKLQAADQQKLVGTFITDLGNAKSTIKEQR